jgi:hypothetical protein
LARPLSFDCTIAWQVDIWNDVINAFRSHEFARIDNTCRPALLLIEAEKLVKQLTNVLRKVGLSPFDMRESPENRVKKMIAFDNFPSDLHHVSVSGAADLIASFHLDKNDAPLRFDFRISPCDNKTTLTLRPTVNTGESNRLFKTYLDNRPLNESEIQCSETSNIFRLPESYVKNRNNWPFYKPLTWQANGSTSAWFTVDDETQTNFSVDWIREKPVRLTLSEAIKMVIEVLC